MSAPKAPIIILVNGPLNGQAMPRKISGTLVFTLHGQTGHYNSTGFWVPKA